METTQESQQAGVKFLVCVDGSSQSHTAYEVVTEGLFKPSHDFLTVCHIYNNTKTYLPFN
jgi:hypothetical protein